MNKKTEEQKEEKQQNLKKSEESEESEQKPSQLSSSTSTLDVVYHRVCLNISKINGKSTCEIKTWSCGYSSNAIPYLKCFHFVPTGFDDRFCRTLARYQPVCHFQLLIRNIARLDFSYLAL